MAIARGDANSGSGINSPINVALVLTEVSPLIVAIAWQGAETISSVTWNTSETLTHLATVNQGAGNGRVAAYGIKNPSATSANVTVTFSANPGSAAGVFAVGTTGGDTTTGWRTIYTRSDTNGTGPGRNVDDSQADDLVMHAACVATTSITFDAGEDTSTNGSSEIDNIAGNNQSGGLSTETAAGASHAVGCTDATFYGEIAFAMMPATGGGPSPLLLFRNRFIKPQRKRFGARRPA